MDDSKQQNEGSGLDATEMKEARRRSAPEAAWGQPCHPAGRRAKTEPMTKNRAVSWGPFSRAGKRKIAAPSVSRPPDGEASSSVPSKSGC